jgi:hypothetical protein
MFYLLQRVTLAVSKVRHLPHLPQLRYGHKYLSPLAQARSTQYNIMWFSLPGYSGFLHQSNWPPRYNWVLNIVESGVKHHNPNPPILCLWRCVSFPWQNFLQIHVFANGGEFEGEVVKTIIVCFINHFISHMQGALYLLIFIFVFSFQKQLWNHLVTFIGIYKSPIILKLNHDGVASLYD